MIRWLKKLVKFYNTSLGRPYVDITAVHSGDRVSFEVDYNAAFIRELDKHGYIDLETPDAKIGEYLKNVLATTFTDGEFDEEEG